MIFKKEGITMSNETKKLCQFDITRISNSSWFKLRFCGKVIHLDPGFYGLFENQDIPILELKEKADFVFVSHNHKDHMRLEMIERIWKPETKIICPKVCQEELPYPVMIVRSGDEFELESISFKVVDAYNSVLGRSTRKFHEKGNFVGYLIKIDDFVLYFAGDTDVITEMTAFGNVDIALLPIGGTYVMDLEEAIEATKIIQPSIVIPMHQALSDLIRFKTLIDTNTSSKAIILNNGESYYRYKE